jgi:hypothetical protein
MCRRRSRRYRSLSHRVWILGFLLKRWCDTLALSLHLHLLFAACLSVPQVSEAIAHREQIILIPNIGDRKRLLLQLLQRSNVTIR